MKESHEIEISVKYWLIHTFENPGSVEEDKDLCGNMGISFKHLL